MEQRFLSQINMSRFEVGSTHMIEVTHINDPKSFYVRLRSFKDDIKLLEEKGRPMTITDASIGKRVVYKSNMMGKFIRGDIEYLLFRDEMIVCDIFAVDYGCREREVPQNEIFMPKYNIPCPPLSVHCKLYLCEPKNRVFDNEALDAMRFFVGTHPATITVKAQTLQQLTVELRTLECPDDVSTMLGLLHFTTLTNGENELSLFSLSSSRSQPIKYKKYTRQFTVGQKIKARVQSGDSVSSFYVVDFNEYYEKLKEVNQFVEYCARQPMQDVPAAAADGRACGVRVNQPIIYERAIVKRITVPDSKALVKLVDWGKEMEVHFCDIKPVKTPTFARLPALAIHCTSTEDQIFDNGYPDFLHPCTTFVIEIMELGDGIDVPHKVNISPIVRAH